MLFWSCELGHNVYFHTAIKCRSHFRLDVIMKITITLLVLIMLVGCAEVTDKQEQNPLTIHYSGTFKLKLPASALTGASILYADGPSVMLQGGEVISGVIVTRELEELPEHFDLALYPRYLLGLDAPPLLSPKLQESFTRSLPALGLGAKPAITEAQHDGRHFYSACGDSQRCVMFMVSSDQKQHLLMLDTEALNPAELMEMIGFN